MSECRALLDAVIDQYPETADHLDPNATIVKWADLTWSMVVSRFKMDCLSASERKVMEKFELDSNDDVSTNLTLAQKALLHHSRKGQIYDMSLVQSVPPTSNSVERLFSIAKGIFSPHRQSMTRN